MTTQDRRLYYWPGRRRRPDELSALINQLGTAGWQTTRLEPVYDEGPPPGDRGYPLPSAIRPDAAKAARWWIGLSLGAAVAHIVTATVDPPVRPNRLTLINSFANRAELAHQRGFAIPNGWGLAPATHPIPDGVAIDLVVSMRDEKIPQSHADRLREALAPLRPRIVAIGADHSLSDIGAQRRLAEILLEEPQ